MSIEGFSAKHPGVFLFNMISYLLFPIGIALLIKGADYLVDGASSIAKKFGISTLVIGLTIVAFGTSTPELVVSVLAAINGSSDVAFGNVVGSNIANILLILGISALVSNLKVQRSTTWKEIPFSLLAALTLTTFFLAGPLDDLATTIYRFEGIILILFFVIFLYYIFGLALATKNESGKDPLIETHKTSIAISMILAGLASLYFGGKWVVEGAVLFAGQLGLSELLIGSTIVAVGTSLPELITSIVAAKKGEVDLAVGNIVGSNIFNIFWVLGITSIISPIALPAGAIADLIFLVGTTLLLFIFLFWGRKHEIEKWQGVFFLLTYLTYITFLILRG